METDRINFNKQYIKVIANEVNAASIIKNRLYIINLLIKEMPSF